MPEDNWSCCLPVLFERAPSVFVSLHLTDKAQIRIQTEIQNNHIESFNITRIDAQTYYN